MASIGGATEEKIFQIKAWSGLNENPDGDTKLALGEAAAMRNFRVTRDGNLQRRPGSAMLSGLMYNKYKFKVDRFSEVVREDRRENSQITMYPSAYIMDGCIYLQGQKVVVTHKNQGQYQDNVYFEGNEGTIYRFFLCERNDDVYTWHMKRVYAVPVDEENEEVSGNPVSCLWAGNVEGIEHLIGACDGKLYDLDPKKKMGVRSYIGTIETGTDHIYMFGYSNILYILNGKKYLQWNGTTLKEVEGYRPLVLISVDAITGAGTILEEVNKLNGKRRAWYSPKENESSFKILGNDILSVDYVKDLTTNASLPFVVGNISGGKVVGLESGQAKAVNSLEIGWTVKNNFRNQVESMRYAEIFNGETDNRVFLYGDGTNQAFYSGLDYDGNPRADYFPDMNVMKVGEANTPITALIRHYSRLVVYKTNSTYSVQYSVTTLADGSTKPAFYVTPVNRSIGNAALGQVRLVLNSPRSLFGNDIYEWRNNSSYSSNLSVDERQAKRISDRINSTLRSFDLEKCYCYDDNDNQEYYICFDGKALVHNYAVDAWYLYTDFYVSSMVNFQGKLYYGTPDGKFAEFSYANRTDFGDAIKSYWESGSISFGKDYMRKYSAMLWVGIKPEEHGEVWATVQTDKKSVYAKKVVASSLATFTHANFGRWSFNTNRKPHMSRLKIKVKKFVFYKLIFETEAKDTTTTILSADLRVRYTGYAR